ncbi:MAG: benzoylformate decarboxylase, partial [Candidatus Eremiobacteraeota bacterium]|nr:benzoylformate decarboxylase [Candidatus Eremiobacteraeota bacterium]
MPAAIEHAYHVAMQRPFGPTFVSIPEDDWDRETVETPLRRVIADVVASPEGIETILAALAASARPAIVVGPGVDRDDASAATVALAERLGAAVYVSPLSSRCSFPERHPNFAGFLAPVRTHVVERLREHDLVLVLGAPVFTYHVFTDGPPIAEGTVVVQVTDDPDAVASAAAGTSIVATLRATLDAVLACMPPEPRAGSGVARAAPR